MIPASGPVTYASTAVSLSLNVNIGEGIMNHAKGFTIAMAVAASVQRTL